MAHEVYVRASTTPVREAATQLTVQALARPAAPAPAPPPPLPRRRLLATASAAATASWSAGADTASPDGAPVPAYTRVDRPEVSGGPPWGPAPKPPSPDPWAAEDFSPGRQLWAGEEPVSPRAGRLASGAPLPGTPAPADDPVSYTHLTLPTNREV